MSDEYKIHLLTLELLRRARLVFLMKDDATPESLNQLLDDIDEHCPQFIEDEPTKNERYDLGDKLKKALNLIESVALAEFVDYDWYDKAEKFLKENGRDINDS